MQYNKKWRPRRTGKKNSQFVHLAASNDHGCTRVHICGRIERTSGGARDIALFLPRGPYVSQVTLVKNRSW